MMNFQVIDKDNFQKLNFIIHNYSKIKIKFKSKINIYLFLHFLFFQPFLQFFTSKQQP